MHMRKSGDLLKTATSITRHNNCSENRNRMGCILLLVCNFLKMQ